MPFVVISCAFKISRVSGRGRGKPVLICNWLVVRSCRKRGNRQTERETDRQTHLQTKYHNPRCACTPRVNAYLTGKVKPAERNKARKFYILRDRVPKFST